MKYIYCLCNNIYCIVQRLGSVTEKQSVVWFVKANLRASKQYRLIFHSVAVEKDPFQMLATMNKIWHKLVSLHFKFQQDIPYFSNLEMVGIWPESRKNSKVCMWYCAARINSTKSSTLYVSKTCAAEPAVKLVMCILQVNTDPLWDVLCLQWADTGLLNSQHTARLSERGWTLSWSCSILEEDRQRHQLQLWQNPMLPLSSWGDVIPTMPNEM